MTDYTKKMISYLKMTCEKVVSVIVKANLADICPCIARTLYRFLQTFFPILRYWTRLYISIGTPALSHPFHDVHSLPYGIGAVAKLLCCVTTVVCAATGRAQMFFATPPFLLKNAEKALLI